VPALVISLVVLVLLKSLGTRNRKLQPVKQGIPNPIIYYILRGFLLAGLLMLSFLPAYSIIDEFRRCPGESGTLTQAEARRDWKYVVSVIDSLLQQPLKKHCRQKLITRRSDAVLEWQKSLGPGQARVLLAEAIHIAQLAELEDVVKSLSRAQYVLQPASLAPDSRVVIRSIDASRRPDLDIFLSVKDSDGFAVDNLEQKDIDLAVNGELTDVRSLAYRERDSYPINVAICIDASGSMEKQFSRVRSAATAFIDMLSPHTEAELIVFKDSAETRLAWTKNKVRLMSEINKIEPSGETALYDAIDIALEDFVTQNGCKAIVLVTDGTDTHSSVELATTLARVKATDVAIYAIGIRSDWLDSTTLAQIAESSRGDYVEVDSTDQLALVYAKIGRSLRNMYRLTFTHHDSHRAVDTLSVTIGGSANVLVEFGQDRILNSQATYVQVANGHDR
ncbi:VWA domain-containing protein, partial [Candidatus Zixiibacteriota bacterium]